MARVDPQVNIRIPAELKTRLESAAAASGRSFTAEVVQRLKDSFDIGEALENSEAQASEDRVSAAVALLAIKAGGKGDLGKFAKGFIRTTRDIDAIQKVVDDLDAAIAQVGNVKKRSAGKAPTRAVRR